ncbi:hypothetical protein [Clostridium sp. ZBS2]|uniref:hypothetical protein n=1 Tax=Clostridium sp. ZBS2 TaxID=2949976 RepID=UPI00338ECF45
MYYCVDKEYYVSRGGMYGHYDDAERFEVVDRAVFFLMKPSHPKSNLFPLHDALPV